MKLTDYHSSSSDEEDEEANAAATGSDENRLSDDDEHIFTDEEAENDEDDDEDDEEAYESADDEDGVTVEKLSSADFGEKPKRSEPIAEDDEDEDSQADSNDEDADAENDDDDKDGDDESDSASDADPAEGNADWAKSLAKILKQEKPKNKKVIALSKAKKTSDIVEARELVKRVGFTVDGEAEIKEEKPDAEQLAAEMAAAAERRKQKRAAFDLRIKPTLMDRERERAFKKIATKGVVQLFNAVRIQQRDLSEQLDKAGRLDHKRDAVLNNINKRKFLDVLMGGKRSRSENVDNPVKTEADMKEEESDDDYGGDYDAEVYNDGLPKNSIWSVLKEDFLSNKKMSHWDKDDEADAAANTDDDSDQE